MSDLFNFITQGNKRLLISCGDGKFKYGTLCFNENSLLRMTMLVYPTSPSIITMSNKSRQGSQKAEMKLIFNSLNNYEHHYYYDVIIAIVELFMEAHFLDITFLHKPPFKILEIK